PSWRSVSIRAQRWKFKLLYPRPDAERIPTENQDLRLSVILRNRLRRGRRLGFYDCWTGDSRRGSRDNNRHGRSCRRHGNGLPRERAALVPFAEDHLPGSGLQNRGDRNIDRLADHLASVVDYDHGPVIKIGHALVIFFSFFKDEHAHGLTRQHDRFE